MVAFISKILSIAPTSTVALTTAAAAVTVAISIPILVLRSRIREAKRLPPPCKESDLVAAGVKFIRLEDGRLLEYHEYGCTDSADAETVLFFHGVGGTGEYLRFQDHVFKQANVRIVAPTRPGYGFSDAVQDRSSILEWTRDVEQLADALKLNKFGIIGLSAGGCYACACLLKMPHRLTSVVLVGSMAPICDESTEGMNPQLKKRFALGKSYLSIMVYVIGQMLRKQYLTNASKWFEQQMHNLPEADRRLSESPQLREHFEKCFVNAFQRTSLGFATDCILQSKHWGFELSDLNNNNYNNNSGPVPVHIWTGDQDDIAPVAMARYLHKHIAGSTLTVLEKRGHLMLFDEAILSSILLHSLKPKPQ